MINPVVVATVAACYQGRDVPIETSEAQRLLLHAQTAGHIWLDGLRERAEALSLRAAELLTAADTRVEEEAGVARAVGTAHRDEP
jgi:hypothetical protein